MSAFVYFRLPEEKVYYKLIGSELRLNSLSELHNAQGFVMAPFKQSAESPLVLIQAHTVLNLPVPETPEPYELQWQEGSNQSNYRQAFSRLHYMLGSGALDKVVLAKRTDCRVVFRKGNGEALFFKACRIYPHQMIVYMSCPLTNTWLMATPEVLLEHTADGWHTMALAGTKNDAEEWDPKNQREQAMVAEYVQSKVEPFAEELKVKGPYTTEAGSLYHLRTDFNFQLKEDFFPEQLVEALHPTPAVCGLPVDKAMAAISAFENTPRYYYSGFCGPWNLEGMTNLFVSLRCMGKRNDRNFSMFAGGGLLKESRTLDEWEETEIKLNIIRNILK